jgi:hypothetical protein
MTTATPKRVIPIKQLTAASYSRYTDYKQCPLKAKLKHIDKVQEPGNDAMNRGSLIHAMADDYIKGKLSRVPPELKSFSNVMKELRQRYKKKTSAVVIEETWAFRRDWSITTWNDWNGCALRIKVDCAYHMTPTSMYIRDWKTGKMRPDMQDDYLEQLELYALGALIYYPHLESVYPSLDYLDEGVSYPEKAEELVYTRADLPKLIKTWEKRLSRMFTDRVFPAKPNDKCRWCWYGQSKKSDGGPGLCKY